MAFFKFRFPGQAASGEAVTSGPNENIEVVRRRARHRLMGAVVLVLVAVVGFPLLFDTQPRPVAVDTPIVIPDRQSTPPLSSGTPVPASQGPAKPLLPASEPVTAQASLDAREEVVLPTAPVAPAPQVEPAKATAPVAKATDKEPAAKQEAPAAAPVKADKPAPAPAAKPKDAKLKFNLARAYAMAYASKANEVELNEGNIWYGFEPHNVPFTNKPTTDKAKQAEAEKKLAKALETRTKGQSLTWFNPANRHSGSVTPLRTFLHASGEWCRDYREQLYIGKASQQWQDTACRNQQGRWRPLRT